MEHLSKPQLTSPPKLPPHLGRKYGEASEPNDYKLPKYKYVLD